MTPLRKQSAEAHPCAPYDFLKGILEGVVATVPSGGVWPVGVATGPAFGCWRAVSVIVRLDPGKHVSSSAVISVSIHYDPIQRLVRHTPPHALALAIEVTDDKPQVSVGEQSDDKDHGKANHAGTHILVSTYGSNNPFGPDRARIRFG